MDRGDQATNEIKGEIHETIDPARQKSFSKLYGKVAAVREEKEKAVAGIGRK